MRIDSLALQSFRNYREQTAVFDPVCNVIFGENAQGKTNLLEAIVYLSCGKSPRARSDKEMIGFDAGSALLEAVVFSRDRSFRVRAELFRDRRRKLSVNQVPAKNSAALSEVSHTVFFCPDDLYLIRDGAAARRRFLDTALCQLRPRYAAALAEYNRTYEHKVRILRDAEERPDLLATLPDFNERLVRFGAVLVHYRAQFAARLTECAAVHHSQCSGGKERLEIQYQTVSTIEDPLADPAVLLEQLRSHMAAHQLAERSSRLCLSGPHKDDLLVTIDGRDARQYASQGQTRTAALSMKLAEREIYKNATGEYPILLLDDVLSELDPRRQEFVLNRIAGGQVFITCCEDDRLPQMLGGRVLHVHGGELM
ncbi:DNA replication and repair protein RecF [Oscillibacter sp. PC13]|uniref:DNA replication/repair protein RecF n=1 Tax=Oscillibacter sp. PC13 TaxID=1855299 RepID=UPI0008F27271|nr:DNA replication/repair protein RecF [Oscillibacter sp. PC13]SFP77070.1 DNA replication and repair protein RecF [Oscillibacter sp. PC13]